MASLSEKNAELPVAMNCNHYILLLKSSEPDMTKEVQLFAIDIDEAIGIGCQSRIFSEVEVWENGSSCGKRALALPARRDPGLSRVSGRFG